MEYALGSIITVAVIFLTRFIMARYPLEVPPVIRYSQSHVHNLISPFIPSNREMREPPVTQSSKYLDKISMRVVFLEGKAYWIKDDKFYVADAMDHLVDHESATEVDTMAMDKIQLDKIKMVVEKLAEGK
jgi:hypothetical protein